MSTDRELLALAAKAACFELVLWQPDGTPHAGLPDDTVSWPWNPLKNDGDALRLAVMLNLDIRPGRDKVTAAGDGAWEEVSTADRTREEATRRAITCAAAAMAER